jgi:nicotinamide-nucleotide amidase
MTDFGVIQSKAADVIKRCLSLGQKVVTAESCTGGLVSGALTGISGSSGVVDRGFVTYSNEAKSDMLGIDPFLIAQNGAVSEHVARAMAEGALARSLADIAVSITGIAGPGGGTDSKPVGLVHFACSKKGASTIHCERRFGDIGRENVRTAAVIQALDLISEMTR